MWLKEVFCFCILIFFGFFICIVFSHNFYKENVETKLVENNIQDDEKPIIKSKNDFADVDNLTLEDFYKDINEKHFFDLGLSSEPPKIVDLTNENWNEISDFLLAIKKQKKYDFCNTNINEVDIVKVRNFLNEVSQKDLIVGSFIDDDKYKEAMNIINNLKIDDEIEKQLKSQKFYCLQPRRIYGYISNHGSLNSLISIIENPLVKSLLKKIDEIKVIVPESSKFMVDSTKYNILDGYTNKILNDIVHLDFNDILLSKDEIDELQKITLRDENTPEKIVLQHFLFVPRIEFLNQLYNHLKDSGLRIPNIMIDKIMHTFISDPAQFDFCEFKFWEKYTVIDCLVNNKMNPETGESINPYTCWTSKNLISTINEQIDSFKNMQENFILATGNRFEMFFRILKEERIPLSKIKNNVS